MLQSFFSAFSSPFSSMSPAVFAVYLTITVWLIGMTYSHVVAWRLVRKIRKERGAQDPPRLKYKLPMTLDVMIKALKADREGHMMHFFDNAIRSTTDTGTMIEGGLGGRSLDTIDPVNIEAMLSSQFKDFCLGTRSKNFLPLLGYGIFTQDGPDWKLSRELLRPQFMHTKSEYFAYMQNETERMVRTLLTSPVQNGVDLSPLFFALTLHTTTSVLFGRSSGSMTSIDDDPDAFATAFNEGQHLLAMRARMGKVWWMLDGPSFRAHCRTVRKYVDEVVDAALAEDRDIEKDAGAKQYVFLRALISRTKDHKILRDQLINILLAGRDTTACLLSWTFRLLAEHPDVQEKLRKECLSLPSFAAGNIPTKEEIKSMPYLEVVIREVLRLYPSVPVNTREAVRTTTLPRGGGPDGQSPVLVRQGETVGYAVYTMHRSPEIYGPDANEFRPERWIAGEPNSVDIKQVGWGYLPFNGGPRVCLGQEFATLEAKYTTVRILQSFCNIEWETKPDKSRPEKQLLTLVLAPGDGCRVKLTPAQL